MDIAIVGGGLAGLTAAHDLVRSGRRVALFDDQAAAGGQVRTRRDRGFLVEEGAEGFVAADPGVPALCRDLGIADQIVPQVEFRSLLLRNGALSELSSREAATLLGIPTPEDSSPRGLSTLRDGMGTMADALLRAVREQGEVHFRHAVTRIDRRAGQWHLTFANGAGAKAGHLLLAIPPRAAAALLGPIDPEAAALLGSIVLASNLSVSLAYGPPAVTHDLAASGLVVAPGEPTSGGLRACTFSSSKFGNRAPPGTVLLRAFFRPDATEIGAPDPDWVSRTTQVLGKILGISTLPSASWVSRWPEAVPQYGPEHANLVSRLELRMTQLGALHLAGSAYQPGGVPGAVRSGRDVARQLSRPLPV